MPRVIGCSEWLTFTWSAFRGKDKQAMTLVSEAIRLSKQLPLGKGLMVAHTSLDYARARTNSAWAV